MARRRLPAAVLVVCAVVGSGVRARAQTAGARTVDYAGDVKPILESRCLSCHGPTEPKSGLRVDRRDSLLKGGDSGDPGVVPGDPRASALIQLVSGGDPDRKMPPKGARLSTEQVSVLRAWVEQGAKMPESAAGADEGPAPKADLWSLRPLSPVSPPTADGPGSANPIDAFVRARLRQAKLEPSPPADPRTLARRVHLVALGLPPTPEEVDRFIDAFGRPEPGAAERAYERLVDDVLARPQYGERWAQHWLDVIRWAETWGYETNTARPDSWPYRDWVIRALNDDMPFDRFAVAQIAGDVLGDDAATGFLVAGQANLPGQIGKDEESMRQARQDELDETVKTVGAAFLGLTVGCARCHNHKLDPITHKDYYALQAVFAGLRYGNRRLRGPEDRLWADRARETARELEGLRKRIEDRRVALKLRKVVEPERHTESFAPVVARAVRMAVRATHNGGRPSLFEFEVWTAPEGSEGAGPRAENVALATRGGRASASSFALENQTRHPDNLVDGLLRDGGRFPWTAKEPGPAWVQVDLAHPARVDHIVWQRADDGFPVDFAVEVQRPEGDWVQVAHSRDRMLHEEDRRPAGAIVLEGQPQSVVDELAGLVAGARNAVAEYGRLAAGPQVFAGTFQAPETTYRLNRGEPMQRREVVAPDVPAVFGSLRLPKDVDDAGRRLALARWVASPENPLTARVAVNRVWQHYFGVGLVDTPSDFGRMGSAPTHPELLDWLAAEFIRGGWSLKRVHRLILTSQTFRQAGTPRPGPLAVDAESRLLWRFPPRRLEAEAIRDAIFHVSGTLNTQMGGPGFDFFNQKGGLTDYIPRESLEPASWRRMIYATKIRMQSVDVFGTFDCPDAGQMAPRRPRSTTPVQALGLLNSAFISRMAATFAARVRAEAGSDGGGQVARAFVLALGRPPTPDEARRFETLGSRYGLDQVCRVLFNANEFVFLP